MSAVLVVLGAAVLLAGACAGHLAAVGRRLPPDGASPGRAVLVAPRGARYGEVSQPVPESPVAVVVHLGSRPSAPAERHAA